MKTFDYISSCVKYRNCFFDMKKINGRINLSIYGYVEYDKNLSHISNITVDVEEKLPEDQVVIDSYGNTNLISFLLDLKIAKRIVKRIAHKLILLPVIELDLEVLKDYCYDMEGLKCAS